MINQHLFRLIKSDNGQMSPLGTFEKNFLEGKFVQ